MINLFLRSMLILALLFGLLFAVGMGIITYLDLGMSVAIVWTIAVAGLQFLLGPFIIQWIYAINWIDISQLDPDIASFVREACSKSGINIPKFGIIEDGRPNAFTFGHHPGNARLVITRGLLDMLNKEEVKAVIGHEIGHIKHWDFVVMTVAALVPMLLYIIYRFSFQTSRRAKKQAAGVAIAVAITSYIAYVISNYIVLLLSRVREYYADQFSGLLTHNPNALSSALVKIAYGLSAMPKQQTSEKLSAIKCMGIFDSSSANALALASAGQGALSIDNMTKAMRWDLWNPWALFFELNSTHPLPAKRIRALEKQSMSMGITPAFNFSETQPESYWDEFIVDFLGSNLPIIGFILGIIIGALLNFRLGLPMIGLGVMWLGIGYIAKIMYSYPSKDFQNRKISDLVGEVKVSGIRSIPCKLQGKIIGRGVPGLFYSEDLVMQDSTGFITLDYRQPLSIFEFLFGLFRANKLIGRYVSEAKGWYRRSPMPYLELKEVILDNGEKVTSYTYPAKWVFGIIVIVLGLVLMMIK